MVKLPLGMTLFSMCRQYSFQYHGAAVGTRNARDPSAPASDHLFLGVLICKLKAMPSSQQETRNTKDFSFFPLFFLPTGTNRNISKSCSVLKASGQMLAQISSPPTWVMAALKPGALTEWEYCLLMASSMCTLSLGAAVSAYPGSSRSPANPRLHQMTSV